MKFSIIMPTYNCEKYIAEAINSVFSQTYGDYELIIIDDGSTDNTLSIVKELTSVRDDARVLLSSHGGVSKARNLGLSYASGDYILFMDGDDTWDANLLGSVANLSAEADLTVFGIRHDFYLSNDSFQYSDKDLGDSEEVETWTEGQPINALFSAYNMSSPCNKVYKREIIEKNTISFCEKCVYLEDLKFNFDYLQCANIIKVLKQDLYHYRLFLDEKKIFKRNFGEPFVNADELYSSAIAYLDSKNVKLSSSDVICGILLTAYFNELVFHLNGKNAHEQKKLYHSFRQNNNLRTLLKNSHGKFNKLLLIMGNSLYGIQLRLIKRRYG